MRTSIDLPDQLLQEAKRIAETESTTLRALVEQGLRRIIAERRSGTVFRLADRSVPGSGLQPGIREGVWDDLRDLIYSGRGT